MKFLFLSPVIDAEHQIAQALQSRGVTILFCADAAYASQLLQLQGENLDLALIHREGMTRGDTPGLGLIAQIKADPNLQNLPIILTTSDWNETECANHQDSPEGVNAYLHAPFSAEQLIEMIEAVLETNLSLGASQPPSKGTHKIPPKVSQKEPVHAIPHSSDFSDFGIILEEANFSEREVPKSGSGIFFENPTMEIPMPPRIASAPLGPAEVLHTSLPVEAEAPAVPPALEIESSQPPVVSAPAESVSSEPFELQLGLAPAASTQPVETELGSVPLDPDRTPPPFAIPDEGDAQPPEELPPPPVYREQSGISAGSSGIDPSLFFVEPVGDAVVPGGAAHAPDLETVKKYLLLREQDVGVLSNQLKAAHEQIAMLESKRREEKAKNEELIHLVEEQKRNLDEFEKKKSAIVESLQNEIDEMSFRVKTKVDKARILEAQVRESTEQMEKLKERVRQDIRKIRIREKELENQLEIAKKDAEALITARENKIIELKRKMDLLEFNMDLLQERFSREKQNSAELTRRLEKAAQVVRVAGGLLDSGQGVGKSDLEKLDQEKEAA